MNKLIKVLQTSLFAVAVALGVSSRVFAVDLRLGFVDKQMVLSSSEYGKQLSSSMADLFSGREAALQNKDKDLKEKYDFLQRDADILSASDKAAKEKEIRTLQEEFAREYESFQKDLANHQDSLQRAFESTFNEVMNILVKQENLSFVLPKQVCLNDVGSADYTKHALILMDKHHKNINKTTKKGSK